MLFTSMEFLFFFLPLTLAVHFLLPQKLIEVYYIDQLKLVLG